MTNPGKTKNHCHEKGPFSHETGLLVTVWFWAVLGSGEARNRHSWHQKRSISMSSVCFFTMLRVSSHGKSVRNGCNMYVEPSQHDSHAYNTRVRPSPGALDSSTHGACMCVCPLFSCNMHIMGEGMCFNRAPTLYKVAPLHSTYSQPCFAARAEVKSLQRWI